MPASRREFVFGMGAIGAFKLFSSDLLSIDRIEPELILYNGNFWTVNPHQPRAQAVAISGGRFLAIGTNDEVLALAVGSAKKIDLGGKTVLPALSMHTRIPRRPAFLTCGWWIAICAPLPKS